MAGMTCTSDGACATGLISRAERGEALGREEIARLLSLTDPAEVEELCRAADRVRRVCVGDEVHLRAIVEFSNNCSCNCLYCGLRRDNAQASRYRMSDDGIVEAAVRIDAGPCRTVVLQSGEDPAYTGKRLCGIVRAVREKTSLAVTLSVGQRTYEDYLAFREAGASRYLLRHETASPSLYEALCPGRRLEERIRCAGWLKELGYETGMGCMVGLPGQGAGDLADDVLLMKALDADMIGIGPFIPHDSTPLAGHPAGDAAMVLKMIAVVRLVTRDTNIPATTALGVLDPAARKKAFLAGANVFMPVFTPDACARRYDIYPGKARAHETQSALEEFMDFFESMGRPVAATCGGRGGR
jgi:biotin synthase